MLHNSNEDYTLKSCIILSFLLIEDFSSKYISLTQESPLKIPAACMSMTAFVVVSLLWIGNNPCKHLGKDKYHGMVNIQFMLHSFNGTRIPISKQIFK